MMELSDASSPGSSSCSEDSSEEREDVEDENGSSEHDYEKLIKLYSLVFIFDAWKDVVMPVTARYIQIEAVEPKSYVLSLTKPTFYGCAIAVLIHNAFQRSELNKGTLVCKSSVSTRLAV
ncbi:hypothetical protein AC249_AIPGENE349 [Exaiptasia diaphana]|nr:hypothetical protein AC249_AIPGENE349 [Exaiptasia diaphana]